MDVKRLKADFQLAQMNYDANPTEHNKEKLERARNEFEQAEYLHEQLGDDVNDPDKIRELAKAMVEKAVANLPEIVVPAPVLETPAPVVATTPVLETPAPVVVPAPVLETPAPVVVPTPVLETPAPIVATTPVVEAPVEKAPEAKKKGKAPKA